MYRITYWLLYSHHYYALAVGLLRFRYNFATDQTLTTTFITFYSAATNMLTLLCLPWIYHYSLRLLLQHEHAGLLLIYVFIATKIVRVLAVVLAIIYNWKKRAEILAVIRDFNYLRWHYFSRFPTPLEFQRTYEIRIIRNILAGIVIEASGLITLLNNYKHIATASFIVSTLVLTVISNFLCLVMNQYYFAIQTVILFGHMLNRQLIGILKTAKSIARMFRHQRSQTHLIARCRKLSNDLDELAKAHGQLQALAVRINAMFKLQGLGVLINVFIFNVCLIYSAYSVIRTGELTVSQNGWFSVLMVASCTVYLADLRDFLSAIVEHVDVFRITCVHLEQLTPLQLLTNEFERSLETFRLQLYLDEYHLELLGLFSFNTQWIFSMFASVLMNSILIMQFDYQYFQ